MPGFAHIELAIALGVSVIGASIVMRAIAASAWFVVVDMILATSLDSSGPLGASRELGVTLTVRVVVEASSSSLTSPSTSISPNSTFESAFERVWCVL